MMLGVYLQVTFALIFFRADSLLAAFAMLHDIAGAHGLGTVGSLLEGSLAFALFPVVWFMPNTQQILGQERTSPSAPSPDPRLRPPSPTSRRPPCFRAPLAPHPRLEPVHGRPAVFAVLVELDPPAPFLYFQF